MIDIDTLRQIAVVLLASVISLSVWQVQMIHELRVEVEVLKETIEQLHGRDK